MSNDRDRPKPKLYPGTTEELVRELTDPGFRVSAEGAPPPQEVEAGVDDLDGVLEDGVLEDGVLEDRDNNDESGEVSSQDLMEQVLASSADSKPVRKKAPARASGNNTTKLAVLAVLAVLVVITFYGGRYLWLTPTEIDSAAFSAHVPVESATVVRAENEVGLVVSNTDWGALDDPETTLNLLYSTATSQGFSGVRVHSGGVVVAVATEDLTYLP